MMRLEGKQILVTGAASGIGEGLARHCASCGAAAVYVADINIEAAERVAADINATALPLDVTSDHSFDDLFARLRSMTDRIDLCFSNAGGGAGVGIEDTSDEQWDRVLQLNLMSHVYLSRRYLPMVRQQGKGYLVITASAAGLLNQVGSVSYGVSKHAAIALAEWLAFTHRDDGLSVSVLCPQMVRTAMTAGADSPASRAAAVDGMIEPAEVAACVEKGLEAETFLILPHPKVETYMSRKYADYDRWISKMSLFASSLQ